MGWNLMICISEFKFPKTYLFIFIFFFLSVSPSSGWVPINLSSGSLASTVLYSSHCVSATEMLLWLWYAQLQRLVTLADMPWPGLVQELSKQEYWEQIAIFYSRGSFQPSEWTQYLLVSPALGKMLFSHHHLWKPSIEYFLEFPSRFNSLELRDLLNTIFLAPPTNFS